MKHVLITGATGFCGRYLAAELVARGYRVTGTRSRKGQIPAGLKFPLFRLDITDEGSVLRFIRKIRPDFVCHLAAQSIPRLSWSCPDETYRINVAGTRHLLEALRRYAPKARFLFVSSNLVYGRTFREKSHLKETDPIFPESPYALSKALAELTCLNYRAAFDTDVVIARAFNHFGPGQRPGLVFPDWCRQIVRAETGRAEAVLKTGNLDVDRDFLNVRDTVCAYELLLRRGVKGEIYNVGSGRARSLSGYVDYLVGLARVRMKRVVEKARLRTDDPKHISGDIRKLRGLGWRPKQSVFDALGDMLAEARISGGSGV